MANFISMICPNCGGKLKLDPSDTICVCEYCGTKHIISDHHGGGLLERYNQCPLCKRNDQVKAISGLISETGNDQRFQNPTPPPLAQPVKPTDASKPRISKYVITPLILILIISAIVSFMVVEQFQVAQEWETKSLKEGIPLDQYYYYADNAVIQKAAGTETLKLGIIGVLISLILLSVISWLIYRGAIKYFNDPIRIDLYKNSLQDYEKDLHDYRKEFNNYTDECNLWEKLYYCQRDGIVYVPGTNTYTKPIELREYLHKLVKEKAE